MFKVLSIGIEPATHESADGRLRFLVIAAPDGDVSLGFDGYSWHTHADILAELANLSQTEAVERFIADLLGDRSVIALQSFKGQLNDVWATDDPSAASQYALEDESFEFQYWSGRPWTGELN